MSHRLMLLHHLPRPLALLLPGRLVSRLPRPWAPPPCPRPPVSARASRGSQHHLHLLDSARPPRQTLMTTVRPRLTRLRTPRTP